MVNIRTLQFTTKEIKTLREFIYNNNACMKGCVYPEMQTSEKDCDECEFTKDIDSVLNKIE